MKLRARIKALSMTLNIELDEAQATVQGAKQVIAAEVKKGIGLSIVTCCLSLNGRDPLAASVQDCSLSELGVVSGDILHLLEPQFDPPVTQPVPKVVPKRASLRVEPTAAPPARAPSGSEEPPPGESTEPLLLRHSRPGRVPRLLTWLAEQQPADGPDHLLALALHTLMLEAGLQPTQPAGSDLRVSGAFRPSVAPVVPGPAPKETPSTVEPEPAPEPEPLTAGYFPGETSDGGQRHWQLPVGWKRPGLFKINYALHFNPSLTAVMSVVPMGNVTVVHAVPGGGQTIFTVSLKPRHFIAATESEETADRFQNLRQLSNVFKNSVTVPLLVHLQRSVGLLSPHEWRALPLELQLLILRRLNLRDLLRMRCTSREMRLRADDPLLWKDLVYRDFPESADQLYLLAPGSDWKQLYQQLFRQRAALRRTASEPMPDLMPALPARPWEDERTLLPVAPPIAGIIGGEYDRLPSLGFNPPLALPRERLDSMLPGQRRFGSRPHPLFGNHGFL